MKGLEHILTTLEYEEEDKKEVTKLIGTLRRLMTLKWTTLEDKLGVLSDEVMEITEWYREFIKNESVQENPIPLKEAFTVEAWDKWIIGSSSEEILNLKNVTELLKGIKKEFEGLNVSYKV